MGHKGNVSSKTWAILMNLLKWLFSMMVVLTALMIVIKIITKDRWLTHNFGINPTPLIFLLVFHFAVQPCFRRYAETEKRAAEHFINAWKAESDGFPAGRINTDEWHEFVDRNRSVDIDPYLATAYRMAHRRTVKYEGKENVLTGNGEEVPSKVFWVPVTILEAAKCNLFDCNVRLWVSRDHKKVLKIVCQDYKAIQ